MASYTNYPRWCPWIESSEGLKLAGSVPRNRGRSRLNEGTDPARKAAVPANSLESIRLVDSRTRMKKFELGQTIGVLANVGVIAGIIFLVMELQQNNEMMRAQTRGELSRDLMGLILENVNDSAFMDVVRRGDNSEELSELEQRQY